MGKNKSKYIILTEANNEKKRNTFLYDIVLRSDIILFGIGI